MKKSNVQGYEMPILHAAPFSTPEHLWLEERIITQAMGGPLPERTDLHQMRHVLDIGCGSGEWAHLLAQQFPHLHVTGIDLLPALIDFAQARVQQEERSNVQFQVMNALEPLAFADSSFDLVNIRFAVSWVPSRSWYPLLIEAKRLLRPGGIIRLSETDTLGTSTSYAYEQLGELLTHALSLQGYGVSTTGRSFGIVATMRNLVRETGFVDLDTRAFVIETAQSESQRYQVQTQQILNRLQALRPSLLDQGIIIQDELNRLEHHLREDMVNYWFEVICLGLTLWGRKPAMRAEEGRTSR